MKVIKQNDLNKSKLRVLIYGRNGAGKTYLSASMPKPVLLDFEKGYMTLADVKRPPAVISIEDPAELPEIYTYLRDKNKKYETVVFDTVTSLQSLVLSHITGSLKSAKFSDIASPTKRDWGQLSEALKSIIHHFLALDLHTLFLSQERDYTDEDNGVTRGPEVIPSVRTFLCGMVDVIGRLYTKEVKEKGQRKSQLRRRILLGPTDGFLTKSRIGGIPPVVEPSLTTLIKHLRERR